MRKFLFSVLSLALLVTSADARRRWIPKVTAAASGPTVITANVVASLGPTSGTTITQAVDCTGANALFVHYLVGAATTFSGVSATYNGVAMTQVYNYDPFGGLIYEGCFVILAPPSGSHNVVITLTGSTISGSAYGCTPMSGVNQTTPTGTPNTANDVTGTSGTASTTVSSSAGEVVLAMVDMQADQALTNGSGQTTVWSVTNPGDAVVRLTIQNGAASVSPTFTFTPAPWLSESVPVKP